MHTLRSFARWVAIAAVLTILGLTAGTQPAAFANDPLGACCFANSACQDLQEVQCLTLNGNFIGEATSCTNIDCGASTAVPLLSIFGVIALLGGLGGLGAYRLFVAPRCP